MGIVPDDLFDRENPRTVNVYLEVCAPVTAEQMAELVATVMEVCCRWPGRVGCAVHSRVTPNPFREVPLAN